jgi:hypothetical protein
LDSINISTGQDILGLSENPRLDNIEKAFENVPYSFNSKFILLAFQQEFTQNDLQALIQLLDKAQNTQPFMNVGGGTQGIGHKTPHMKANQPHVMDQASGSARATGQGS